MVICKPQSSSAMCLLELCSYCGRLVLVLHMQGAAGVADIVFGTVSPSGRLPMTFYYDNYTSQVIMHA